MIILRNFVFDCFQTFLLICFKCFNHFIPALQNRKFTIIGIDYSNILHNTGKLIKDSYIISLVHIPIFSDNKFDYSTPIFSYKLHYHLYLLIYRPFLLAKLAKSTDIFFYVGRNGMCRQLENDLKYLRHFKKEIIMMFIGSDIRSPYLLKEFAKKIGMDYYVNYFPEQSPIIEREIKSIVTIAEKYSKFIISSKVDQMSYYSKDPMPSLYYLDPEEFYADFSKYDKIDTIKILHSPTSYAYKGTPLVRAAIKKLKLLGYTFEYVESNGMKHSELLKIMSGAHIVLAEFYSFMPGIVAIEALFSFCTILTSANPDYEYFPEHPKDIWIQTGYWEVFDNLKFCLDNPDKLNFYAKNGYKYANRNYTIKSAQQQLLSYCKMNQLNISSL